VDRIRATLPQLKASIPQAIDVTVAMDQTTTIRASVRDVERTLIISILLVILVVFLFLRSPRTTFIPAWPSRFSHRHFRRHVPAGV